MVSQQMKRCPMSILIMEILIQIKTQPYRDPTMCQATF